MKIKIDKQLILEGKDFKETLDDANQSGAISYIKKGGRHINARGLVDYPSFVLSEDLKKRLKTDDKK